MCIENQDIEHEGTNYIICPFCGWEDVESWEEHGDDGRIDCPNCHNPELQKVDKSNSSIWTIDNPYDLLDKIIKSAKRNNNTNKVVFEGGDPFFDDNIDVLRGFLKLNQDLEVCIYTGYSLQQVKDKNIDGFTFLKCGKYIESKKQPSKKTDDYLSFASTNQELYNSKFKLISKDGIYHF